MIQPARRPDVFGFGHQLHSVCSMRQLSRPADLMIAAWAYRHFSLLAASFLACTIPPDLPHILGSSGGSSRRTPDPDRIASLRQRARGDPMSDSPAAGNSTTVDTSHVPVTAARAFSTQDIPQTLADISIKPGSLHLWPVVFDRICEALGLTYRFVLTRSDECQKYIPTEAKTSDDAQEQVWMQAHGPWREKLEQAVSISSRTPGNPSLKLTFSSGKLLPRLLDVPTLFGLLC